MTRMSASRPQTAGARLGAGLAALIVLGAFVIAGTVAYREFTAHRLKEAAQAAAQEPANLLLQQRLRRRLSACGPDCPASGLLAGSAAYLDLALYSTVSADRARLVAEADRCARRALRRSPASAEGWTRLALAQALAAGGSLTPAASDSLRAAYASAPFHKPVAGARVVLVATNWAASPQDLRARARAELLWLGQLDRQSADDVLSRLPDGFVRDHLQLELDHALANPQGPARAGVS